MATSDTKMTTDLELAEEIARNPCRVFTADELRQIIAALRRGPESWDAEVLRVKISEQLETIRELRQKLERPPSGEMVPFPPQPPTTQGKR
jgi:hypothetical protein